MPAIYRTVGLLSIVLYLVRLKTTLSSVIDGDSIRFYGSHTFNAAYKILFRLCSRTTQKNTTNK